MLRHFWPTQTGGVEAEEKQAVALPVSAQAIEPVSRVSNRYHFVNTMDIHHMLTERGFQYISGTEVAVRDRRSERNGKQMHMLLYSHPDYETRDGNLQVGVRNAHDLSSHLELFHGFFRFWCSNQLYRRRHDGAIRLMHRDYNEALIRNAIDQMLERVDTVRDEISTMRSAEWSNRTIRKYGREVLALRFQGTRVDLSEFDLAELNRIRRPEDEGNSAWLVYNRMQEALVQGLIERRDSEGETRAIRKITSIASVPEFNSSMWEKALALC